MDVRNFIYFRTVDGTDYAGYVGRGGGSINEIMVVGLNDNDVSLSGKNIILGAPMIPGGNNRDVKLIGYGKENGEFYITYGSGNTGATDIYGNKILLCNSSGSDVRVLVNSNGVGIGNKNPSYKLHVDGAVGATAFNNTSDIRKKNIIEDISINVEDIANAPIFKFTWLDSKIEDKGEKIGTSAQYWQTVLPEFVSEANDEEKTLSIPYDVIALASSVSLAKEIISLKNRITELENRIKQLEQKD